MPNNKNVIESKIEMTHTPDTTKKSHFDYAKAKTQAITSGDLSDTISAPQTLEQNMRLVLEKSIKQIELKDQQQRADNKSSRYKHIRETFNLSETDLKRLEQIEIELTNNDNRELESIVSSFKNVMIMHLDYSITKSLSMMREKCNQSQTISKKFLYEIHAGIYGATGTIGSFYYMIRNNLSSSPDYREYIAKTRIGRETKAFQNALSAFEETLDRVFPSWKYWDSGGPVFGVKSEASAGAKSDNISRPEIKQNLEKQGKALDEQDKALRELCLHKSWNAAGSAFGVKSEELSHLSPNKIVSHAKKHGNTLTEKRNALAEFQIILNSPKSDHEIRQDLLSYIEKKYSILEEKYYTLAISMDALIVYNQSLANNKQEQEKLCKEIELHKTLNKKKEKAITDSRL